MAPILASRFRAFQPRVRIPRRLNGGRLRRFRDTCTLAKRNLNKVVQQVRPKGDG